MSFKLLDIKNTPNGIWFNADFEDVVRQNSLLDFSRVMSLNEGEVIKHAVPERKTVRLFLKNRDGFIAAYLKRHYPLDLSKFVVQLIKLSPSRTACDEFRNIAAFHRAGIPTLAPIAAGLRRYGFFRTESFLVTQALEGVQKLDDYFSESLPIPACKKRDIITRVALLVKKMHSCGFNHRDLYLCHILLDHMDRLFLVDLHRVDKRGEVPERWKVKDIAALNYSSPGHSFTLTDRIRFLKNYFGVNRLTKKEKLFALKVLKKTKKMIEHNKNCET